MLTNYTNAPQTAADYMKRIVWLQVALTLVLFPLSISVGKKRETECFAKMLDYFARTAMRAIAPLSPIVSVVKSGLDVNCSLYSSGTSTNTGLSPTRSRAA